MASSFLEEIAETKRSLLEQLNKAETEIQSQISLLEAQISDCKKQIESIRQEKAGLSGVPAKLLDANLQRLSVAETVKPSIPDIVLDPNQKRGQLEAAFCNTHNLNLTKIDEYILVILFNMSQVKEGMAATIEETEKLLIGAGYRSNASNFKAILYAAYSRLKESKLATTEKNSGRTAYYKITNKGIRHINEELEKNNKTQSDNSISLPAVLEAMRSPTSIIDIVARIAQGKQPPDPLAFSQAVLEKVKTLIAAGQARVAGKQDNLTLYQKI